MFFLFTFFYLGPKYLGYHWLPQKIVYDFSVISVLRWVIEVMLRPYSTLLRIAAHPCPCVLCLHFFCDILVIPLLFGKLCQESNQVGFDLLVNSTCQRVPAVWKCPKLVAPGCFAQRAIVTGVELKDPKTLQIQVAHERIEQNLPAVDFGRAGQVPYSNTAQACWNSFGSVPIKQSLKGR